MKRTAKNGQRFVTIGVVVVVLAAIGFAVGSEMGGSSGHTVIAEFADASFIQPGNTVNIDGVTAGSVGKMVVKDNTAMVYLHLDKGYWPIHSDATAQVRPRTLLGEEYIDIDPGTASSPILANDAVIPEARTSTSVNLQSILDAVNDPTGTSLGTLLVALGEGMTNEGKNGAAAIQALAPALTNTTQLLNVLDNQNQLLTTMIDNVQPVLAALDTGQGTELDHLVSSTNSILGATAARQTALAQDLQALPPALKSAKSALTQLGGLANQATPALASLSPLTNNLQTISQDLYNFGVAATPATQDLPAVLTQAQSLIDQAGPVVASLEQYGPTGLSDAQALVPIVQKNVADLNNLFGFIKNWALATQDYDNVSHYFRFFANISTTSGGGDLLPPLGSTGKATASKSQPATTPTTSGLLGDLGQITNPLIRNVAGLLRSPAGSGAPSATGLTLLQEQGLLKLLLGGG